MVSNWASRSFEPCDLLRHLGNRQPVERGVGGVVGDPRERVVLEAALANQLAHLLLDAGPGLVVIEPGVDGGLAAFERPRREADAEIRAGGVVEILIGQHLLAAGARGVDHRQGLRAGPPAARRVHLEVRHLHGDTGLAADRQRLGHRGLEFRALVAHVRGVDAARTGRDPGERHDLVGGRVGAGHVLQAGGEPHGAVAHGGGHQRLHLCQFVGRRGPARRAHHRGPHRVVADERREVDGGATGADLRERRADVHRRAAAVAGDDGRDPHADEVCGRGVFRQLVGMSVHVDEPGRHDVAGGVDDGRGAVASGSSPTLGDAAAADADVSAPPGGVPVPSTTVPPRTSTSKPAGWASSGAVRARVVARSQDGEQQDESRAATAAMAGAV